MTLDIDALTQAVQKNCHISDALYARDYTMCIYLLKMREFFRWEQRLGFNASMDKETLGNWLVQREGLWNELEELPYQALSINKQTYDPFESNAINAQLTSHGLVYSGGVGRFAKPYFFLGQLLRTEHHDGLTIHISDQELARDLVAPPAMTQGNTIYIRRESLRRMLWEKVEEWHLQKRENAMGRAMNYYNFVQDLEGSLDQMADREIRAVILHEIGEGMGSRQLSNAWLDLLNVIARSKAEIIARAVKDNLADCLSTLPELLAEGDEPSLHFYFANFQGMRKALFPQLLEAYQNWVKRPGNVSPLQETVQWGQQHWLKLLHHMEDLFLCHGNGSRPHIEAMFQV